MPSRRTLPPLNALRAFEAFGRNGRMTAAADELFVTHGAVSRQIRQLEQWLGFPLTEGPKTQLKLTPEARRLLGAASAAFDLIEEAAARTPVADKDLRLACSGTLATRWLIPRLPDFLARHPDIRIQLSELSGEVDFEADQADAGIQLRTRGAPGQQMTPFLANICGPVLSPARWAALGQQPDALWGEPRLHSRTWLTAWDSWAASAPLPPPTMERSFEHFSHAIEAAVAGLGVAMSPWTFVADDIARGRLVAPMGFLTLPARLALVRPAGRDNPAIDRLAEWLVEQGARMPAPPKPAKLPS
jgi:LysR family glycine cleavage system transcriptional activator